MIPDLPVRFAAGPPSHSRTGLESTSAILKSAGITRRRIKELDAIVEVRQRYPNTKAEKAYRAGPSSFVESPSGGLPSIPWNIPGKTAVSSSASLDTRIMACPLARTASCCSWIATMAIWHKAREIHFRSAATILETFGLPKDGRYYSG